MLASLQRGLPRLPTEGWSTNQRTILTIATELKNIKSKWLAGIRIVIKLTFNTFMFYTNEERRRWKQKHLFSRDRLFPVFKLNARICSHPTLNWLKRALSRSKVDTCASSFNFPYFEESIMYLAACTWLVQVALEENNYSATTILKQMSKSTNQKLKS